MDISQVAQSLSETTYAMARISDDLQDTIMSVPCCGGLDRLAHRAIEAAGSTLTPETHIVQL